MVAIANTERTQGISIAYVYAVPMTRFMSPLSYTVKPTSNGAPDNSGICKPKSFFLYMYGVISYNYVFSGKVSYCNHRSSGRNRWKCTGRCTRCTSARSSHSSSGKFKLIHETGVY